MTHYERFIHRKLRELHRIAGGAVPTRLLADHLGKNDRTLRWYLSKMEEKNVVKRKGVRGGWMPVVNLSVQ
jgi:DNA-binding CsgD family transcriptional regulator